VYVAAGAGAAENNNEITNASAVMMLYRFTAPPPSGETLAAVPLAFSKTPLSYPATLLT
jgi:hypothetical protein